MLLKLKTKITYEFLIKRGRGTGPVTPGNRYF